MNIFTRIKKFVSEYEKTSLIFLCIFISFIVAGLFTLGGFNGTGKSYTLNKNFSIVYELSMTEEQEHLTDVYINIGNIYKSEGSKATLTLSRSSSDGNSWITTSLGSVTVYNVVAEKEENRNFNWIAAFTDKSISSSYRYIKVSADCDLQLNEIIFIGDDGKVIPVKINSKMSEVSSVKSASATLDRQGSFCKNSSSMFRFSQSEAYIISTINNIKLGSSYESNAKYVNTSSFGALGLYIIMFCSFIFGNGTFGMRMASFISSVVSLLLLYKLVKKAFNPRAAVIFSFCYALSGITLSVGRLATPYSVSICFIVCSIYFMSAFLQKGLSSAHMNKSAANILLSGVFFAFGLGIYPPFFVAYLLVFALFAFGMIRQKKAHEYRLKKLAGEYSKKMSEVSAEEKVSLKEEGLIRTKNEIIDYKRKKSVSLSAFLFGFVGVFLIAFTALSLSSYNYLIKSEGDPSVGGNAFLLSATQFFNAFANPDSTMYSSVNAILPTGWFVSLKGATIFNASYEDFYAAVNANTNIALALLSLLCFSYSAAHFIQNFNSDDKEYKVFARNFCLLAVGFIGPIVSALFIKNCSAEQSLLFSVFYMSFIPLAFCVAGENFKKVIKIALVAVAAVFVLQTPMIFGFKVPVIMERIAFGWTSIMNNGFYRI